MILISPPLLFLGFFLLLWHFCGSGWAGPPSGVTRILILEEAEPLSLFAVIVDLVA